MKWHLKNIEKETNHPFLNFYITHYEVDEGGKKKDYPYFFASRRNPDDLVAFNEDATADGVLILAYTEEEEPKVLLIDIYRPVFNKRIIEFPAGLLDKKDNGSLLDAAKRECLEETGFELVDAKVLCLPSGTTTGLTDELCGMVIGKIKGFSHQELEEYEDISYRLFPVKDIPALLNEEKTAIALTTRLGLLYLFELLQNKK